MDAASAVLGSTPALNGTPAWMGLGAAVDPASAAGAPHGSAPSFFGAGLGAGPGEELLHARLQRYFEWCDHYRVKPVPEVAIAFRYATVTHLALPPGFGPMDALPLCEMLKYDATLTSLDGHRARLGNAGFTALADALPRNTRLRELNLSFNDAGEHGAVALARGLERNSGIHRVYLRGNRIGIAGAVAFARLLKRTKAIEYLDLSNNYLRVRGVHELTRALVERAQARLARRDREAAAKPATGQGQGAIRSTGGGGVASRRRAGTQGAPAVGAAATGRAATSSAAPGVAAASPWLPSGAGWLFGSVSDLVVTTDSVVRTNWGRLGHAAGQGTFFGSGPGRGSNTSLSSAAPGAPLGSSGSGIATSGAQSTAPVTRSGGTVAPSILFAGAPTETRDRAGNGATDRAEVRPSAVQQQQSQPPLSVAIPTHASSLTLPVYDSPRSGSGAGSGRVSSLRRASPVSTTSSDRDGSGAALSPSSASSRRVLVAPECPMASGSDRLPVGGEDGTVSAFHLPTIAAAAAAAAVLSVAAATGLSASTSSTTSLIYNGDAAAAVEQPASSNATPVRRRASLSRLYGNSDQRGAAHDEDDEGATDEVGRSVHPDPHPPHGSVTQLSHDATSAPVAPSSSSSSSSLPSSADAAEREFDIEVRISGNFMREEVTNSVIHGAGLLLSLVGAYPLLSRGSSLGSRWPYIQYLAGLVAFFASATLNHSLFLTDMSYLFRMIDHSAVYVLIAGTYSPFLSLNLRGIPLGPVLSSSMWTLAVVGVAVSTLLNPSPVQQRLRLVLYLLMGWLGLVPAVLLYPCLHPDAWRLLAVGGAAFSLGVALYLHDRRSAARAPLHDLRSWWYITVLLACGVHYAAVYHYTHWPAQPCLAAAVGRGLAPPAALLHHAAATGSAAAAASAAHTPGLASSLLDTGSALFSAAPSSSLPSVSESLDPASAVGGLGGGGPSQSGPAGFAVPLHPLAALVSPGTAAALREQVASLHAALVSTATELAHTAVGAAQSAASGVAGGRKALLASTIGALKQLAHTLEQEL